MSTLRLVPPHGTDWTIEAVATAHGVELAIAFTLHGQPITARFAIESPDARKLAAGILTAAGDGTMRTFPRPKASDG